MVRIVLRLSRLAKLAASVAALGGLLAVYGHLREVAWATDWGRGLLFGGAVVYLVERGRMMLRARRVPRDV